MPCRLCRFGLVLLAALVLSGCGQSKPQENKGGNNAGNHGGNGGNGDGNGGGQGAAKLIAKIIDIDPAPDQLFAKMPAAAFPKTGGDAGLERAAARKWILENLVGRELSWMRTIESVEIEGNGPFKLTFSHPNDVTTILERGFPKLPVGKRFSLGGQQTQLILSYDESTYDKLVTRNLQTCSETEARALRELKGQPVKFRAIVLDARILDHFAEVDLDNERTEITDTVGIVLEISNPAPTDEFLEMYAGPAAVAQWAFSKGARIATFGRLGDRVVSMSLDSYKIPKTRFQISEIDLSDRQAANQDLALLSRAPTLQTLNLAATQVTDAGIKHLASLSQLKKLDLSRTAIDDAGVEELKGLKQLEELKLYQTGVTDAGLGALGKALPNCKISK